MKLATMLFVMLGSVGSFANAAIDENLACNFTEPFISVVIPNKVKVGAEVIFQTTEYTTKGEVLVIHDSADETSIYAKIPGDAPIRLIVSKTEEGSDGMSDRVYEHLGVLSLGATDPVHGGCE